MKNNGFTLVELLAVIILLTLLITFVYPKVINIAEKKEEEIDSAKVTLIQNAVLDYMYKDINKYPQNVGAKYCFKLEDLDNENLIPTDISEIKKENKVITVTIGKNNSNRYEFGSECK